MAILVQQRLVVKWLYQNLPIAGCFEEKAPEPEEQTDLDVSLCAGPVCALVLLYRSRRAKRVGYQFSVTLIFAPAITAGLAFALAPAHTTTR